MRCRPADRSPRTTRGSCTARSSGFGADGPYADLPAYDDTVQAVSGIAGAQEWMAGAPTYAANAMADKIAGLTAAFAIAGRAAQARGRRHAVR